ncbi:MAG: hypothetical protein RIS09_1266 [Actinomycetota bacterium]
MKPRRQSLVLLAISLLLFFVPIINSGGFRLAFVDYITDISGLFELLLDPQTLNQPNEFRVRIGIFIVQLVGWITFAIALLCTGLYGVIRNRATLKYAAILSALVLVHGVLEVIVSVTAGGLDFSLALFSRFGIDFADFLDDYDALLNSTVVPLGLLLWFFITRSSRLRPTGNAASAVTPVVVDSATENS